MKRTFTLLLSLTLIFSVAACSAKPADIVPESSGNEIETSASETVVTTAEPETTAAEETRAATTLDVKTLGTDDIKVGDYISFGDYKGHSTWRVLDIRGSEAYITTADLVDEQIFDDSYFGWDKEDCFIRLWLNNEFYNEAFTDEERKLIVDKTGNKVLLLTIEEAHRYFKDDADRYIDMPDAETQGYWLRDKGLFSDHASLVECDFISMGAISEYGAHVEYPWGVRPSMWIRLNDSDEGDVKEKEEVSADGCFTITRYGSVVDLTGLTDEGKGKETLVIPAGTGIFGRVNDGNVKNVVFESDDDVDYGFLLAGCDYLESVTLPANLTRLGRHSNCPRLKAFVIPKGVKEIPTACFDYDKALEKVVIEGDVTKISNQAFRGCTKLKEISLPDTVGTIGDYAFAFCENLSEIRLPKDLKKIGMAAFRGSKIEVVTVPEEMELTEWDISVFSYTEEERADASYMMYQSPEKEYRVLVKEGSWADIHFAEVFGGKAVKEYY